MEPIENDLWKKKEDGSIFKILIVFEDCVHAKGLKGVWNGSIEMFKEKFDRVC